MPSNPVRFVTAASLFDGHDASINIMRRLLMAQGCEVVHLGHNRSVDEVVTAVIQEDPQGVAISSYQGGHVEYFEYLVDRLRDEGYGHVKVYGGGGGVIVPSEIDRLHAHGVTRIFSPQDGQRMGLEGMITSMVETCDVDLAATDVAWDGSERALARAITRIEAGAQLDLPAREGIPVLGITGTGGAGKSSLTDELLNRLRRDLEDKLRVAVIAIDPTRRKGGGALLGDRIRMNALGGPVFFRSLATRSPGAEVPEALPGAIAACKAAGYDLVIVETPGIGQGDAGIVPFSDVSLYVMTPEFGAASQLEKIDMLDFADAVAINKFDRRAADDAYRSVRRQLNRERKEVPLFGTIASRFNDDGVTGLYQFLRTKLALPDGTIAPVDTQISTGATVIVPPSRERYLAEIAEGVRSYHATTDDLVRKARVRQHLLTAKEIAGADVDAHLPERDALLDEWPAAAAELADKTRQSLSGLDIPRVAVPRFEDDGELLRFIRKENVPGRFPFTAGVFPLKREGEDPARMFAGEGSPARTNRRFHLLAEGQPATRLSTAFDSVTLYGFDPDERPDIYGKVGNSGVSIATLEDMKVLFDGFDLIDPKTSVSMTINGPAPSILAMYLNTAIDQHPEMDPAEVLKQVRGTVQADILKEDQGQNTCIFSTEFSLRCMADVQQYFVENAVRNFYSVSISGYHMAEAGANPISQLAFTLANGFTYVEAYLARGMDIDDFAPNLSFFFSNGMDPEYTVMGRVARRIWAVAMKERYGANDRSQKLKYHIQTSGRSLHAQEMDFNDIRTTLQALCAIYDNANSLHTNAYDEAVTTPTAESVRRALAIQLIINREWGLAKNENPLQGSYVIDELTDLVEEAVLGELEAISSRGGVLGAMETGYQRGRIQDESMLYEHGKHDGSIPIVGVNTFRNPDAHESVEPKEVFRSSDEEKQDQLRRLRDFHAAHAADRPATIERLQQTALDGGNVFGVLMDAVRCCSLGQITDALFEVGGRYRRNV
jgi:methylmalonyl-CoA mutase